MGRMASALLLALTGLAGSGCVSISLGVGAPSEAHGQDVCTRLSAASAAPRTLAAVVVPTSEQAGLRAAAARQRGAVVHIQTRVGGGHEGDASVTARSSGRLSGGTGVVIAADGLILTNEHVVRGAGELHVILPDGTRRPVVRVAADRRLDLAVLRVVASDLPALTPTEAGLSAGTPVVAVGWPRADGEAELRTGVVVDPAASLQDVLDPTDTFDYARLIESTTALEPGFSGGPLLDMRGRLVGLNVAVRGAGRGQRGYSLPFGAVARATVARLAKAATPDSGP